MVSSQVRLQQPALKEGSHSRQSWPHVRFLREGDPEPPTACEACGREWHGLTRVCVIERVERTQIGEHDG